MAFNFTIQPPRNAGRGLATPEPPGGEIDILDLQMAVLRWARRVKHAHREIDTDLMQVYVDNHFTYPCSMDKQNLKLFCQERWERIGHYYHRILLSRANRAFEVMRVPNKHSDWCRPTDSQYVNGNCILTRTILEQLKELKTCYLERQMDLHEYLGKLQALRGSFDTMVSPLNSGTVSPATIDADSLASYQEILMSAASDMELRGSRHNRSGDLNDPVIDVLMETVEVCAHLRTNASEMFMMADDNRTPTIYAWALRDEKHHLNPITGWMHLCKRNPLAVIGMCRNTTYRFPMRDPEPVTDERDPAVRVLVDQETIDRVYCSIQVRKQEQERMGKGRTFKESEVRAPGRGMMANQR